jgi:tRNA pseudouridine38-40 synthase
VPHFKLTLSYDGSPFHGWQVQPGLSTVQGCLAAAIAQVTGQHLLPQGSGRTDAGVHALGQVASFTLRAEIPAANLHRALNRVLPPSIRIDRLNLVDASFHARHSALGKLYEYRIFERRELSTTGPPPPERICSPFLAPFVWDCRWPLDLASMQTASLALVGTHDFTSFAATDPDRALADEDADTGPNPVKTIHSASWTRNQHTLAFRVHGSGFLHHMVRNLVGTLVDVGRGSLHASDIPRILAARDRSRAGPTAPASGLFLVQVFYDDAPSISAAERLTHLQGATL